MSVFTVSKALVFLAAVRTQDIASVGEEAASEERGSTLVAAETVGVPVAVFKRDELGPVDSCVLRARAHTHTHIHTGTLHS